MKLFFLLCFILYSFCLKAQVSPTHKKEEIKGTQVAPPVDEAGPVRTETLPGYPLSDYRSLLTKKMDSFLSKTNIPPGSSYDLKASFIIAQDGNLTDVRLDEDPGNVIGDFYLNFFKNMLHIKWMPATCNGHYVKARTSSVRFTIANSIETANTIDTSGSHGPPVNINNSNISDPTTTKTNSNNVVIPLQDTAKGDLADFLSDMMATIAKAETRDEKNERLNPAAVQFDQNSKIMGLDNSGRPAMEKNLRQAIKIGKKQGSHYAVFKENGISKIALLDFDEGVAGIIAGVRAPDGIVTLTSSDFSALVFPNTYESSAAISKLLELLVKHNANL